MTFAEPQQIKCLPTHSSCLDLIPASGNKLFVVRFDAFLANEYN
jgi:hypothetical protein